MASANAWTFAASNNIATITTTNPHGLTFNPAANTLANYFVTFAGNITGQTGVGTLIGNTFRILTIPSTTTFTIYTTVTAATAATTASITPVFVPQFQIAPLSGFASFSAARHPGGQLSGPRGGFRELQLHAGCELCGELLPGQHFALLGFHHGRNARGRTDIAPTARRVEPRAALDGWRRLDPDGRFGHHRDLARVGD